MHSDGRREVKSWSCVYVSLFRTFRKPVMGPSRDEWKALGGVCIRGREYQCWEDAGRPAGEEEVGFVWIGGIRLTVMREGATGGALDATTSGPVEGMSRTTAVQVGRRSNPGTSSSRNAMMNCHLNPQTATRMSATMT